MLNLSSYFINTSSESLSHYENSIQQTTEYIIANLKQKNSIYSGANSDNYSHALNNLSISQDPMPLDDCLQHIVPQLIEHSLWINSPKAMAHLHCPVTLASLAAEQCIALLNQSMDSWDQSPFATYIEQSMINMLCHRLFKDCPSSDGIFTSGGTQSNLMGLLMARDNYCKTILQHDVVMQGLPRESSSLRILCSEHTHFSVHKSLHLLGLGHGAITVVATDKNGCLCPSALITSITELERRGLLPIAIVATAGGTDLGQIDPLERIAEISQQYGLWLHVDAAVGGSLVFSHKYRNLLSGIEQADSITVDFHKLFFQPISCGALFCKRSQSFSMLNYRADYLNPEDGILNDLNLVNKSIQTTRRFDALKLNLTLKHAGTLAFGQWIDHIIDTTRLAYEILEQYPHFQTVCTINTKASQRLNTLVFRFYDSSFSDSVLDHLNQRIHKSVFYSGEYAIALTTFKERRFLKITLVNPQVTLHTIKQCLAFIEMTAHQLKTSYLNTNHEADMYDKACI